MNIRFDAVYYEPGALDYELGQILQRKYASLPWIQIENHNRKPLRLKATAICCWKIQ